MTCTASRKINGYVLNEYLLGKLNINAHAWNASYQPKDAAGVIVLKQNADISVVASAQVQTRECQH